MMKKELEKDPTLARKNWDRFLPKFKKKNVKQKKVKTKEKKTFTPFPPPRQPSKIDEQLASGEFIMSLKKNHQRGQMAPLGVSNREIQGSNPFSTTLNEPRKMDTKSEDDNKDMAAMAMSLKAGYSTEKGGVWEAKIG
ncbi:hypothetical protein CMV_027432 [Castanea mollissima]|uniref:Uncharacterized protein n=1 Tax=Castanea mollissima TaxID=60419 RepID=A0A8J4V9E0_9ROSI|nr:hypothetical protein CMV_027432 [Castanea mollissima]